MWFNDIYIRFYKYHGELKLKIFLAAHPGAVLAQSAQGVGVKPEGVRHYRSNWPLALDE